MKKQYSSTISNYLAGAFCVYLFLSILFLTACGYDGTSDNEVNNPSETGSFACTLNWPDGIDADENTPSAARAVECMSAGIDAVVFTFYKDGSLEDQSYFDCDAGRGRVDGLPVGSNYQVVITAEDTSGTVLYQGEYGPFAIEEGVTTKPADVVDMWLAGPLAFIVGSWVVDYDWYCNGYDGTMIITLKSDFTFSAYEEGVGISVGTWSLAEDQLTWIFENGTYSIGSFADFASMEGTMFDGVATGCWEASPYSDVADDNYEDNDSIDAAVLLSPGVNLSAIDGYGVAVYNDYDYYKIEVPYNNATIEINCSFSHDLGDIDIELFDAAGDWIDVGDQGQSADDNETIVYEHTSDASPTTYYIKVYLYSEDAPNTYDLIWDATPAAGVNLTGMQYVLAPDFSSFSVDPAVLVWGQYLDIDWAIINTGTQAIPAGTDTYVDFYLSEDAVITESDEWLGYESLDRIFSDGLSPNSGVYDTTPVQLPAVSPFSSSSGTFYIGMVVDADDDVAETNENDNSGTGAGIDYAQVNIAPLY